MKVRVQAAGLLGSLHLVSARYLQQTLDKKVMSHLKVSTPALTFNYKGLALLPNTSPITFIVIQCELLISNEESLLEFIHFVFLCKAFFLSLFIKLNQLKM
jgi:hypothetical protein